MALKYKYSLSQTNLLLKQVCILHLALCLHIKRSVQWGRVNPVSDNPFPALSSRHRLGTEFPLLIPIYPGFVNPLLQNPLPANSNWEPFSIFLRIRYTLSVRRSSLDYKRVKLTCFPLHTCRSIITRLCKHLCCVR